MIKETYNLIVLDKSGSMQTIAPQAVAGVNETIATIRKAQKETGMKQFVTVTSFCGCGCKDLYHNVLADDTRTLTLRDYRPCCMTPLYDAIGTTCTRLRNETEGRDDVAVSVTIITDGYENASHEWNLPAIKKLIESLKADGWLIAYIGANQDLEAVKVNLSISNTLSFDADAKGTAEMFSKESYARMRWSKAVQACNCMAKVNDDYFADIPAPATPDSEPTPLNRK